MFIVAGYMFETREEARATLRDLRAAYIAEKDEAQGHRDYQFALQVAGFRQLAQNRAAAADAALARAGELSRHACEIAYAIN